MKRTIVNMILAAVLSAIAGQSWAQGGTASVNQGSYSGGTVKIYGANYDPAGNNTTIVSAAYQSKVYLVVEADYTHSNLNVDWRVQMAMSSSHAQSRGETPGYGGYVKVDYESGRIYSFTMPEDVKEVVVNAVFPAKETEDVTYIDPTAAPGAQEKLIPAYILDGTETKLGSNGQTTWYVCATPATANDGAGLSYGKTLTLLGNVNLILADGCKMSVGSAANALSSHAIYQSSGNFTIYGQTDGSGTLAAYGGDTGISCNGEKFTINGGTVDVNASSTGIQSNSASVTINDGKVSVVGGTINGIYINNNSFAITGGKVSVIGGNDGIVSAMGSVTLGWRHPDDYIYASSYKCASNTLFTAARQRFVSYDLQNEQGTEGFDPALTKTTASVVIGSVTATSHVSVPPAYCQTNPVNEKTIVKKTLRPIAVAETDEEGVTTVSPGYLLSVTASDITPVGRTEPDFTLGTTPYYIYKAGGDGVTIPVSVKNYGQEGVDFEVSFNQNVATTLLNAAVSGSGERITAALPWTGTYDVKLRLALSYCTGVKYMDWDDAQKKLVDTDTSKDADPINKVYLLTGNETTDLPGGWYVVKNLNTDANVNQGSDAFYTNAVKFTGDTHLILADGARMDVDSRNVNVNYNGIYVDEGNLSIYAQSLGDDMGILNTFPANSFNGIVSYSSSTATSIIINGGNISCEGSIVRGIMARSTGGAASVFINGGHITFNDVNMKSGIFAASNASSSVIINDGIVDLKVSNYGIEVAGGSSSNTSSTLAIYGGKVKDNSPNGFTAYSDDGKNDILLGWKNPADYIYTTKYSNWGPVRTVDGQYLMACDAPDVIGKAYGGTLDGDDINAIAGHYLRPAIYYFSMPDNVNLSITDGSTPVNPLNEGSVGISKHYYLYKDDLTVNASLKNDAMLATIYMTLDNHGDNCLTFTDGHLGNFRQNVNAVGFTMPATNVEITIGNLSVPTTGGKYLAFVDDIANVTTDDDDVVILVFKELRKTGNPPVIEAVFEVVDEVPEGLPVIFAYKTEGHNLPASIRVSEPTSANADAAAETIRQAASPLFMTGTAGQTVADVLRAALTDAAGNPLLDSNNLPLSLNAADYVIFLFDANKFVPVAASASSKLTGRRYLLVVDKVTLLQLLNGSASAARSRAASATDGLTAASGRVWTFPLILGNDATGISSMFNVQSSMDTWFTIDGRRLQNRPAHKGVYINNGKKTVIK